MTTDTSASTTPSAFLTTEELAAYLKVPVPTVRMWRHNRTGPRGVRLGRHVRYRRTDVDRWIEANERAQRPRAI